MMSPWGSCVCFYREKDRSTSFYRERERERERVVVVRVTAKLANAAVSRGALLPHKKICTRACFIE